MSSLVAFGFPNPVGWAIDKVTGFVGDVATAGFELIVGGLVAWVVDAVMWVVGGVFNFFLDAADPNVQADWFITGTGPYATTAVIGATLLVGFVLAGITQGVLAGDVGGMLRRIALDLPLAVLGMVGLVSVTQALIALTDALSRAVLANFQDDVSDFTAVILSLSRLGGGSASAFVVFLLGLVTVIAGIILVAELSIRAALIYIVVALAPLAFAAQLWPALRGVSRKLLELLCALILSKLVIAIALSVAAAAAVGAGSGGEVTSLPEPEVAAEDPGGSVTQAVGILLAATAAFGVSAFSPLLIAKLLPLTEAALIAQGVRSGPTRASQQATSMAYSARMLGGHRTHQLAAGRPTGGAGAGAGLAASGVTAAAGTATRAARTGARTMTDAAVPPAGDPSDSAPQRGPDPSWRRVHDEPDPPPHPAGSDRPASPPRRPATTNGVPKIEGPAQERDPNASGRRGNYFELPPLVTDPGEVATGHMAPDPPPHPADRAGPRPTPPNRPPARPPARPPSSAQAQPPTAPPGSAEDSAP
ncbi:MAG TPA: hypothetical protein VNQ73_09340 [Ilumatobacter sp.]|nr:hypothetical protein [Ilumatobacter sp.]